MRKVIISISGLIIIGLGFIGMKTLSKNKKTPEKIIEKTSNSVYIAKVVNSVIPIKIKTSGSVLAKDRFVIYSEVQGVCEISSKPFKAGINYKKNEALIRINKEEFNASVIAQRSIFKNLITSVLADIKFDYPSSLSKWEDYLNAIDITNNLPSLPTIDSEQEKNFITGKNIFSTFYSIENLEVRLKKYVITAPYNGALVEALVTPGTLISPGQKLGTFIRGNVFELELNINASLQDFLKLGTKVNLTNLAKTKTFVGTVTRVNPQIDRSSQTIKMYVQIESSELKEGEYLEASIYAKDIEKGIKIDRALLINNNSIYIVEEGILKLIPVLVVYENRNTVVIEGIKDGVIFISRPVSGAFEGMPVKVITD